MKLEIDARGPRKKTSRRDAYVVLAVRPDAKKPSPLDTVPEEVREAALAGAPAEAGSDGTLFTVPLDEGAPGSRLYVVGAGKSATVSPRKARTLLRSVVKALEKHGETSALLDFPLTLERMDAAESREFVLRSLVLSGYRFDRYKSTNGKKPALEEVAVRLGSGPFAGVELRRAEHEARDAEAVAAVTAFVRDLGNTPSNDMVPRHFAAQAEKEAKRRGVKATVLGKKEIAKERMGGLLAVNRGAEEEPRFVVLEWRGGKKDEPFVALVGKGVTFDSGGISIKPAEKMGDMKWDMMGAAAAVGAVLAAAELKLPVNVVSLTPLTENLPSGSAYKPGDIVRFRNGKTAEIDNTDAEGRVILADALDYAGTWKPSAIVDFATLTGAALVAIGLEAAIVFTADDALARELVSAGERTDERLWRLPLWDDYKENIKSDWADVKNTGGRWGGSINGAMFLKEFVPEGVPWAHLDIAPTADYDHEHAGYPIGASGYGVALTLRWLRDRVAAKP